MINFPITVAALGFSALAILGFQVHTQAEQITTLTELVQSQGKFVKTAETLKREFAMESKKILEQDIRAFRKVIDGITTTQKSSFTKNYELTRTLVDLVKRNSNDIDTLDVRTTNLSNFVNRQLGN